MIASQLRKYVIEPTLELVDLKSESAIILLLGTCAQESHMGRYLHQIIGPARGIYQIEPRTEVDILRWVEKKYTLRWQLCEIIGLKRSNEWEPFVLAQQGNSTLGFPWNNLMVTNLAYATLMARLFYLRIPRPLPSPYDAKELGKYWKKYYNTKHGKGTVKEFADNYRKYVFHP